MTRPPILYIGVAAPLIEEAQVWGTTIPDSGAFPYRKIAAYGLRRPEPNRLVFRTGRNVSRKRVVREVAEWSGAPPELLGIIKEPVQPIDHRRVVASLKQDLHGHPVQIETRIGLTLQQLQKDWMRLRQELALLYCHGTKEGCLLFEDGRARAEYVPGERLFPLFQPRPKALFLNACHSEAVLERAKDKADWKDSAIVYIDADTPIEVGASAAFHALFYQALLGGESVADAYASAQCYVANDPNFGDLSVTGDEKSPSAKFQLKCHADVRLTLPAVPITVHDKPAPPHVRRIRRMSERFIGRRREMVECLDALLPLPPGIHHGLEAGGRRIVTLTLTKEGGIGKTTLAVEIADWVEERRLFPGGVFELPCERYGSASDWLSRLLHLFGVPPEQQRGDLLALLHEKLSLMLPPEKPALLVLDNLDELFSQSERRKVAGEVLETALTAASALCVLATCRWQLGLANHEAVVEVRPMDEDEARDVFLSYLLSDAHKRRVEAGWKQPDSPIRQLVRMSGRHPQSLHLLALQMSRKGMTLAKLRDEAHVDLLEVLIDPLAADNETDRLKKVEVSYQLSYLHLSEPAQRLFERLSRLPGGVWCGEFAEQFLPWTELLGAEWRKWMEKELDHYALVHYEPAEGDGEGRFVILPAMLEFARKKYQAAEQQDWEAGWIEFWALRLRFWDVVIEGRVPDDWKVPQEERCQFGVFVQQYAKRLFAETQENWLAVFEVLVQAQDDPVIGLLLLHLVRYFELSGQRVLLKSLAEQAVAVLRSTGPEAFLASSLDALGNVLRNLGERENAGGLPEGTGHLPPPRRP